MRIALIEDKPEYHDLFEEAVRAEPTLTIERSLSRRIDATGDTYRDILGKLSVYEGQLTLIVDLNLGLHSSQFEDGDLRSAVELDGHLLQRCEQAWGSDSRQNLQGLWVATRAVLCPNIEPLLILFATTRGALGPVENFLNAVAKRVRPTGRYRISRGDSGCTDPEMATAIVKRATGEYDRMCGERLAQLFRAVESLSHSKCESGDPLAIDALGILLRLNVTQVRDHRHLRYWLQGLKYLGAKDDLGDPMDRPLSLLAGWLCAIGAYRECWPNDDWEPVFDVVPQSEKGPVASRPMTPPQSWTSHQTSIRAFDHLCCRLFKRNDGDTTHPDQKVTLTDAHGLVFNIGDFDPTSGQEMSLYCRLSDCSTASFSGLKPIEKHHTADALWAFLISSYRADMHLANPHKMRDHVRLRGIFGSVARLNIRFDEESGSAVFIFR